MSVVHHIRDRAGRFRWMGLLVVWTVFIAMAAVLLVERAGVQYSAGQHKLGMLAANDAVPASSAIFGQNPRAWLFPIPIKLASTTLKTSSTRFCWT